MIKLKYNISIILILISMCIGEWAWSAVRYVDNSVVSSGNGQSWATAWKTTANISGLSPGDTVYFSGGFSGKTYTVSNWSPPRGTPGNPITYAVGQDAGHTGMVTFDGSGNFLQGNLSDITFNGEVNGSRRMSVTGSHGWLVYTQSSDNTHRLKLLYMEFYSPIWAYADYVEIGYCYGIAPLSMQDDSFIAHIGDVGASGHTVNLIHHNYFQVNRIRRSGFGQDCFKWVGNVSIFNNVILSVYNASYSGSQHNDGIQTASSHVWVYNNYFEGFISYPIYNEMYGSVSDWRIFNNVISSAVADETSIDWTAYQCMALGFSSTGTITDYIVSNNTCIGGSNRKGIHFNTGVPGSVGSGCYIVNNIVYNSDSIIFYKGSLTVSNNVGGTSGLSFVNKAPYPNGDFRLTASAINAIGAGISPSYLTAVYTFDKEGYTRTGTWDIGAYKSGVTGDIPGMPRNLRIQ